MQLKGGIAVNDDRGLEEEADRMGGEATVSAMRLKADNENGELLRRELNLVQSRGRKEDLMQGNLATMRRNSHEEDVSHSWRATTADAMLGLAGDEESSESLPRMRIHISNAPVQMTVIDPNTHFLGGVDEDRSSPMGKISDARTMFGFGGLVGTTRAKWRTTLKWGPIIVPAPDKAASGWLGQGRMVTGVVGPDHKQGSPASGDGQKNASLANGLYPNAPGGLWVGGHLLNAELGGPGNDIRNIHVFSTNANHSHDSLEEKAKKMIQVDGQFIKFETEVHGPGFPDKDTLVTAKAMPLATNGEQYGDGYEITFKPVDETSSGLKVIPPTIDPIGLEPATMKNISTEPQKRRDIILPDISLAPAPLVSDQCQSFRDFDRQMFPAVNTRLAEAYMDSVAKKTDPYDPDLSDVQMVLIEVKEKIAKSASDLAEFKRILKENGIEDDKFEKLTKKNQKLTRTQRGAGMIKKAKQSGVKFIVHAVRKRKI